MCWVSLTPLNTHHTLLPWRCLQILRKPEQQSCRARLSKENISGPEKGPETFCCEASANIAPRTQQGKLPQHLTTIKAVTPTHTCTHAHMQSCTHWKTKLFLFLSLFLFIFSQCLRFLHKILKYLSYHPRPHTRAHKLNRNQDSSDCKGRVHVIRPSCQLFLGFM